MLVFNSQTQKLEDVDNERYDAIVKKAGAKPDIGSIQETKPRPSARVAGDFPEPEVPLSGSSDFTLEDIGEPETTPVESAIQDTGTGDLPTLGGDTLTGYTVAQLRKSYQDATRDGAKKYAKEIYDLYTKEVEYQKGQGTGVKKSASDDAKGGMILSDLQNKYAGKLETDEIVEIYTGSSPYGEPKEGYAREVLGLEELPDLEEQDESIPWYQKAGQFFGIY
ncbi:MAG TPA: hypothetical protein ENI23_05685 [bacterium]|nr:hypothetical protein [bacterium]